MDDIGVVMTPFGDDVTVILVVYSYTRQLDFDFLLQFKNSMTYPEITENFKIPENP